MTNATNACEGILNIEKEYNNKNDILPSVNKIIDQMLSRSTELTDAYEDIIDNIGNYSADLRSFFLALLHTAAFWNPEQCKKDRDDSKNLIEINREIGDAALRLENLLEKRTKLNNISKFHSETYCHIVEAIEDASANNHLFNSYVRDELHLLSVQFDLKYWPSIGEIIYELAQDAYGSETHASDSLTKAAITGTRPSLTDFFKALFQAIEENCKKNYLSEFRLKDDTWASLANCALGKGSEDLIDREYVKRLRQRIR